MSQYKSDEDVRNYDIFKGIVTALLLITLFIIAAMGYGGTGDQAAEPDEVAGQEESMEGEIAEAPAEAEVRVPDLLSPAPGTALDSGPVTFSGMGTPGSQVALLAAGTELGRTLVDENGTWELDVELPPSVESIELQAIDSSGTVVAGSDPIPMTSAGSTAGQEQPQETGEETAEPYVSPTMNLPEVELYVGEPITLSGTGQPGTTLQLLASSEEIGMVPVAEDGTWTLEVELQEEGDYEIDIVVLDEDDLVVETVPAISIPVLPAKGPSFVLPELPIPNFNPLTGSLAWSGESAPGSRVAALVDDQIVDEATADDAGQWNLNLNLEPGAYSLAFGQLDEAGNVTSSTEPFDIEVPDRLPQIDLPEGSLPDEVQAAIDSAEGEDALQAALNSLALSGLSLPAGAIELTGSAEPGQEVALLINGEVTATAVADEEGNITLPADLTEAARTLQLGVIGDDGTLAAKSVEVSVSTAPGEEAVAETPAEGEAEQPAEEPAEEPVEEPAAEAATGVSGTVTYTEPLTLPGDAVVSVQIIDLSTGAAAEILGEQTIELGDSQIPIPYEVPFNPEDIDEANLYGVTARIETADGTLLFVNETNALVITDGNPTEDVEIVTAQVRSAAADAALGVADTELAESAETVLQAMENSGQFDILLEGLEEAGLSDRLAEAGAYTLFAPTDAAFEAMPPGILAGWQFNPDEFGRILANMVVEGQYGPEDLTNGLVLRSILQTNIGVQAIDDFVTVNGIPIIDGAPAGESYVYALPRLILPPLPAGLTAPSIDQSGVPIFTGDFLTVVGVGEPGYRIVLNIDNEPFGRIATVNDNSFWQVEGDIGPGIHNIVAYLIDDNGLLQAISNEVTLAVAGQ